MEGPATERSPIVVSQRKAALESAPQWFSSISSPEVLQIENVPLRGLWGKSSEPCCNVSSHHFTATRGRKPSWCLWINTLSAVSSRGVQWMWRKGEPYQGSSQKLWSYQCPESEKILKDEPNRSPYFLTWVPNHTQNYGFAFSQILECSERTRMQPIWRSEFNLLVCLSS